MNDTSKWDTSPTTNTTDTVRITSNAAGCKHIMRVHTTDGLGNQWETCTICGMKFAHVVVAGSITERFEQIEARVTALEVWRDLSGTPEQYVPTYTVGTTINTAVAPEAPSDEAAAVERVRVRNMQGEASMIAVHRSDIGQVLAALDRATAQLADARSEAVALRATEENLRAQLAARTDATPLGFVTEFRDGSHSFWRDKGASLKSWEQVRDYFPALRVAVPVYEHPPRPVAPDYQLVGACVVESDGGLLTWTVDQDHSRNVLSAVVYAKARGGTPYRLYRGEPITEATP